MYLIFLIYLHNVKCMMHNGTCSVYKESHSNAHKGFITNLFPILKEKWVILPALIGVSHLQSDSRVRYMCTSMVSPICTHKLPNPIGARLLRVLVAYLKDNCYK